ncbi:MAG: adenylate/guanylate cyclase domain-containing protein [bacterium]|nr:adenylate/guanylate cyclase domain-containing protein [bacterium]
MATLIYYDLEQNPIKFKIKNEITKIGRKEDNDIVLTDIFVSRYHVAIVNKEGKFFLVDKGSSYGTLLNSKKIDREELKYGDEIKLGNVIITFVDDTTIDTIFSSEKRRSQEEMIKDITLLQSELDDIKMKIRDRDKVKTDVNLLGERLIYIENEMVKMHESFLQAKKSNQILRTMYDVGKVVNSVTDLRMLMNVVMDLALKVVNAERGYLMLHNTETNSLITKVARNMGRNITDLDNLEISQSIAKDVFRNSKPILTIDAQNDDRFSAATSVVMYNIRSVICVPLLNKKEEPIGIIYVDNIASKSPFTEDDKELLSTFANYVAVAIENATLFEKIREEEKIRNRLSRYMSNNVVNEIISGKEMKLGGEKKVITTLFSDIRGFTTMSEKMQPEEVVALLNEYFTLMTEVIFKYEGTLDKFIGDCIMAVFGAPFPHPDDPIRAVKTAIEMRDATIELNKRWLSLGRKNIGVGIGINTGEAIAGNIGSLQRMDYTVISDAVNLAERLEANAPAEKIYISDSTYQLVKDHVNVMELEPIKVKGKTLAQKIYEVISIKI